MHIRLTGIAFLLLASCASEPVAPPAAPVAAPVAAQPAAAAATESQPKTVQAAQKAGWKIVNQNGKEMYCREQLMTGSHMRKETICLTAEELELARTAQRRGLEQLQRSPPSPPGN